MIYFKIVELQIAINRPATFIFPAAAARTDRNGLEVKSIMTRHPPTNKLFDVLVYLLKQTRRADAIPATPCITGAIRLYCDIYHYKF